MAGESVDRAEIRPEEALAHAGYSAVREGVTQCIYPCLTKYG